MLCRTRLVLLATKFRRQVKCGSFLKNIINQAYETSRKRNKSSQDPIKTLIDKQQKDGFTGDNIIQRIQTNPFSYDILFNDRIINNLANFCCTNNPSYKSLLTWDFTFDLGKNPPYYALVLTYRNTTLLNQRTKKSPVMLGFIWYVIKRMKDQWNYSVIPYLITAQA